MHRDPAAVGLLDAPRDRQRRLAAAARRRARHRVVQRRQVVLRVVRVTQRRSVQPVRVRRVSTKADRGSMLQRRMCARLHRAPAKVLRLVAVPVLVHGVRREILTVQRCVRRRARLRKRHMHTHHDAAAADHLARAEQVVAPCHQVLQHAPSELHSRRGWAGTGRQREPRHCSARRVLVAVGQQRRIGRKEAQAHVDVHAARIAQKADVAVHGARQRARHQQRQTSAAVVRLECLASLRRREHAAAGGEADAQVHAARRARVGGRRRLAQHLHRERVRRRRIARADHGCILQHLAHAAKVALRGRCGRSVSICAEDNNPCRITSDDRRTSSSAGMMLASAWFSQAPSLLHPTRHTSSTSASSARTSMRSRTRSCRTCPAAACASSVLRLSTFWMVSSSRRQLARTTLSRYIASVSAATPARAASSWEAHFMPWQGVRKSWLQGAAAALSVKLAWHRRAQGSRAAPRCEQENAQRLLHDLLAGDVARHEVEELALRSTRRRAESARCKALH